MSVLAKPKKSLNPSIWNANNEMHPELRTFITELLIKCLQGLHFNPNNWIYAIYIIGSNTSNQYSSDSDLDIDVEIDMFKLLEANPDLKENTIKEVKEIINNHFANNCNTEYVEGTSIPINFHCSTSQASPVSEGMYDLVTSTWKKQPVFLPLSFDSEKEFSKEFNFVDTVVTPAILKMKSDIIREAKNNIPLAISKARKFHKIFHTLRNMRFIDKPQFVSRNFSLNWDYRNVIYKILESKNLIDIKAELISAYPEKKEMISNLWDTYHYKSNEVLKTVYVIQKLYENQ